MRYNRLRYSVNRQPVFNKVMSTAFVLQLVRPYIGTVHGLQSLFVLYSHSTSATFESNGHTLYELGEYLYGTKWALICHGGCDDLGMLLGRGPFSRAHFSVYQFRFLRIVEESRRRKTRHAQLPVYLEKNGVVFDSALNFMV